MYLKELKHRNFKGEDTRELLSAYKDPLNRAGK